MENNKSNVPHKDIDDEQIYLLKSRKLKWKPGKVI